MLTEIRVSNPGNLTLPELVLPIGGETKFPIQFIDGLAPSDAEISTSKYAIVCGEHFEGSRVNVRNIILTLELSPDYGVGETPEQLRAELYKYFATKHKVDLIFGSDGFEDRSISGYVESFEAPLFVELPAAQISIVCPNPYFEAAEMSILEGTGSRANPLILESIGDIGSNPTIFASTGIVSAPMTLTVASDNLGTQHSIQFTTNTTMTNSGIRVVSHTGEKLATIVPENVNLLPHMTFDSTWPRINPGVNRIWFESGNNPRVANLNVNWKERFIGL